MTYVFCDFETKSEADITKVGAWNYSAHESTDVLCFVYAADDMLKSDGVTPGCVLLKGQEPKLNLDPDESKVQIPEIDDIFNVKAKILQSLAADPNVIFVAHHAFFEQAVWQNVMVRKYNYPPIGVTRWRCTRALAWAHGLPGNLEGACKALNLPIQKNSDGKRLIKLLCCPPFSDDPSELQKLYDYCIDDVLAMRGLFERLRPLTVKEQTVWEVDQIINQRGIQIDIPLLQRALLFIEYQKYENAIEFEKLTGLPRATLRAQFQTWVNRYNDVPIPNTQAGTIKQLIAAPTTHVLVKTAAEIYQQAQKSSLIKYEKALQMSDSQGIYREVANYYGAHLGRWTSWGAQWQNPPRPKHNIENVIANLKSSDYRTFEFLYGSITMPLSSMIRGLVIPRPNKKLYVGDYVQIEARGLAWLAGDEPKLELYHGGMDVYSQGAKEVFQVEVSKKVNADKRQAYKVLELANQYAGGIGAGANFSKQYDFNPEPLYDIVWHTAGAEIQNKAKWSLERYKKTADPVDRLSDKAALAIDVFKQKWRLANPKIVAYWSTLENAVRQAIYTKQPVNVGPITFFVDDVFLYCRLPTGRDIVYPYPDVSSDGSISYWGEDNNKFVKIYTYGGKFAENVTQALCREFLAWAMVDLEKEGFPVVLHLHDEAICEVDLNDERMELFKQILAQPREWAPGFPIDIDAWEGVRYDKR